ncbi:Y-family DNA polymerase [Curvivirga aplysinae]|uniref:Y-family DNA polymerase n=1 Tax=Curvivirga aplysinae TaxID=2529852 RepID=UPI0012BC072C|nr:DNA polymerase Y family protein [Curvivirga aplysinae]MTI08450.1 DNA polymerase Y family protein [Curvivirga aplysinae]
MSKRKRYISLYLPQWAIDCRNRQNTLPEQPYVQTTKSQNQIVIETANDFAYQQGIKKGMSMATARAISSTLIVEDHSPDFLQNKLEELADWAYQFTPFVACDGVDSLILDVTGCSHLFGGEQAMLKHLSFKLSQLRLHHQLAIADTSASAWGLARYATKGFFVQDAPLKTVIQSLPIAAMRLSDALIVDLQRMGLRQIKDLLILPRSHLSRRYGLEPVLRLDKMLGDVVEPITPRIYKTPYAMRMSFPDAIGLAEDIEAGLDRLIAKLCTRLEKKSLGAKKLHLICDRVNKTQQSIHVGLSEPNHNPRYFKRLFLEKLKAIEPGFGIDCMRLLAPAVEKVQHHQNNILMTGERQEIKKREHIRQDFNILIDRLRNRLGYHAVGHIRARDTHLPDRIQAWQTNLEANWPRYNKRPSLLHNVPILIHKGTAPNSLLYKGKVEKIIQWHGPERISPNWWQKNADWHQGDRDYYIVHAQSGHRYWIYHNVQQTEQTWYLHGCFS